MGTTETKAINSEVILLLDKLSDESRMPLYAIIGFSEVLLKDDVHSKHKESIDHIRQSGEYLMELIKDVADFAKLRSGQLKVEKQPVNLEKIIATLAASFRDIARNKGLELKIIQHSELPCRIYTDANLLKRGLKNLIDNALKYTADGHVYMRISLTDYKGHPGIEFRIEDTGGGMAAEQCDDISKEFNKVNLLSLNKFNCTGFGLPITHEIVNMIKQHFFCKFVFRLSRRFCIRSLFPRSCPNIFSLPTNLR